ncbi:MULTISPECIES: HofP DNA utilization family protein [Pantoea]|jgi:pilus assembly protein HofP|uniref:DUF2531 family protein n=1 Tax=Pantoea eucrina TaxID=472693 RepID=A0ABS1ZAT7_9GAMM|nr:MULTISPECIES: HofP DNA utilization family protein [Pantoea]AIX49580.1 hypothetical protein PSNIH1_04640 [Pantoea sp. PSNIH1]KAA6042568.1 DUF2531 family protein [Pantoea sp. Bo_7]KAA6087641.1 DUF2531 family protein [Pantoea sp. Bo_10]MBM0749075.1 DUF2531 family protein [Pantoea eucrina]MCL9648174.1 DUF2531 family protein [Pantoea eucrina]
MRSSALLCLLLWVGAVAARNPFVPLTTRACEPPAATPQNWRLQGVAGRAPHFVAWVISPEGKSYRLEPSIPFPVYPWQVAGITARTLTLTAPRRCVKQQIVWVIKGGFYETDRDAAGAYVKHPAAGADQHAEPGI